jgi:Carbohydrate esterase, sialic acid-specific acetylesterase
MLKVNRWMIIAIVGVIAMCSLTATAVEAAPKLELAAPFTDNMILQREMKVPVWGFSQPGSEVTVEFAGQKKSVAVDKSGEWRIDFDPLEASAVERVFKVTNNRGESIELKGVLVGEVWFSSGQSNMVWLSNKSLCSELARQIAAAKEDIPIREISINTVSALYPQKRATSEDGGWKKGSAATGFSARSLSFAYEIYKELKVPVGILLSAHSNTRVEAFTQRQAIEAHPKLKEDVDLMHDGDVLTEQGRQAFEKFYQDLQKWQKDAIEISQEGGAIPRRPNLPGIAGQWRGPSQFFNGKFTPVIPYAIRGALWCQGESNASDGPIYASRMEALVQGWRDAWNMPDLPFYFTQLQAYGSTNVNDLGMADLRQVQHLYFRNNRKNVGMVVQTDLNSAHPNGIHYANKLHPGMRLARWALAKQYGKDIAFTGPIYTGYKVDGNKAIVSFEKESLFGGLMVGSKGMEKDFREPDKFVEPARPTPNDKLNHFRLCGADRKWYPAAAVIEGDTVVVTSKEVPNPIGVQYAYCAVPENSNLYNKAGLPATPFAVINGELIFQAGKQPAIDPQETKEAETAEAAKAVRPFLQVAEYYRESVIVQRDKPIPVWGHANAGTKVTVALGKTVQTATANALEQWSVTLPARPASSEPVALTVEASHGLRRSVGNILVGDVWYLTGCAQLTSEMGYAPRNKDAKVPEPLPGVREFKRNTSASTNPTPRKRGFEIGGGRFSSRWVPARFTAGSEEGVTMFAYEFAKALNRPGVPQGFITMSSGGKGMFSPLSWTSYAGVKDATQPAFQARLNELKLQYPESDVARKAFDQYLADVKACADKIQSIAKNKGDLSLAPLQYPAFPEPGKTPDVTVDLIPTYTYNWCVSPLTPMAVAGVIWVPSQYNIGNDPSIYATELEIYAKSLPQTYGQQEVQFLYAQPSATLVKGITTPAIPNAKSVTFDAWPKSLKEIAAKLAEQVK